MKKLILISLALLLLSAVFAQSNQIITIGTDTKVLAQPICCQPKHTRSASIYLPGEIGGSCMINTIGFNIGNSSGSLSNTIPLKVFMKMTTAETLAPAVPWPSLISGLTPVFEGYSTGANNSIGNWKYIVLNTPFNYTGNNLQIMIESEQTSENYHFTSPQWYGSSAPLADLNQLIQQNDPPPTTELGVLSRIRPNIYIAFNSATYTPFSPAFGLAPLSVNFGSVKVNTKSSYADVSVYNNGGGTITITGATLGGIDASKFILDLDYNFLPWTLAHGEFKTIKVALEPTAIVPYSAYLDFVSPFPGSHRVGLSGMGEETFPATYDFGTLGSDPFPPPGWVKQRGVLATPTYLESDGTGDWVQKNWKNITIPANKAAGIILNQSFNGWLISPVFYLPTAGFELVFDVAFMTRLSNNPAQTDGIDDEFLVLIGNGDWWTPANIVRKWDNAGSPDVLNSIPPAGMTVTIPFANVGYNSVAFYAKSTITNANNELMIDNFSIRQTLAAPIVSFPFVEGFETGNTDQSAGIKNWTQTTGPQYLDQYWKTNNNVTSYNKTPRTGQWNACLRNGSESYLCKPAQLIAGKAYSVELYARQDKASNANAFLQVRYGTDPSIFGLGRVIIPQTELTNGDYQRFYGIFSPNTTGLYYIGIGGTMPSSLSWYISLDDITINQLPDTPVLFYAPHNISFGTVMHGVDYGPKYVTISNNGGGILNIASWDISLINTGAAEFSIGTGNLPVALAPGQSVQIPVYLTPTTTGNLQANLRITNNQTRTDYNVSLSAEAMPAGYVIIGNGNADLILPISANMGYNYSQSIFMKSELNLPSSQRIQKLHYYWNGNGNDISTDNWTIYMGHTALTQFASSSSWVPSAQLSQVYQGQVVLPATAGWIEIPLNNLFIYNNTDNLVIAVDQNLRGTFLAHNYYFLDTASTTNRSIIYYNDNTNPNPANPPAGTLRAGYPNLMLGMVGLASTTPVAPILDFPLAMTNLPKAGFELKWTSNIISSPIDYYKVYLWKANQSISQARVLITTGTSLNPASPPNHLGNPQTPISFNYLDFYYWTVEAFAIAYPNQMAWAEPSNFTIEANPIISSFPWQESFETYSFPPTAWLNLDVDNDGESWIRVDDADAAHTGNHFIASASWRESGALTPDNWLITAPVILPATGEYSVEYYVGSMNTLDFAEHYGLYVSTTGAAPADFTLLHQETLTGAAWSHRHSSLGSYAGQTLRLAFRHFNSTDLYFLKIDDLKVRITTNYPVLTYMPATWDFGVTHTKTPSTPKDFVLGNDGTGTITINTGNISLIDPEGNFVITAPNLPANIAAADTYTFSVQFIPQSAGSKTATLTIQDNVTRAIHSISLSGEAVAEPLLGILNLAGAAVAPNNVALSWSTIYGNPGTPGYLHWDDNIDRETMGILAGTNYNVATKFGTDVTTKANGMKLKSVMIHLGESPQKVDAIKVWKGTNNTLAPATLLYTQAVSGLHSGWNNIVLTTPQTVSGANALYVGFHITSAVDAYVASFDGFSEVPGRGNLIDYLGWQELSNFNKFGNWLIHPYFEAASTKMSGNAEQHVDAADLGEQHADAIDLKMSNHSLTASPSSNVDRALLGFNIYRNGVKINGSPVAGYSYLDEDLAAGTYQYAVQSVQHSAAGQISSPITVVALTSPAPVSLPFTEDWSSGNFSANKWSISTSNWAIKTDQGAPMPSASFGYNPEQRNYSSALRSRSFNATALNNVQFSFDLYLDNDYTSQENVMTWQVWNGSTWITLGSYSSTNGSLPLTHYSYDVSAFAGNKISKIRFVASGTNSNAINAWYIDNISITGSNVVTTAITGLSIQHSGSSFLLNWNALSGANRYNVYISSDPYSGFVLHDTTVNSQLSILQSQLPAAKAFFKVTAVIDPLPGADKRISPPAIPQTLKNASR